MTRFATAWLLFHRPDIAKPYFQSYLFQQPLLSFRLLSKHLNARSLSL